MVHLPVALLFKRESGSRGVAWKKRSGRLNEMAEGLVKAGALQFGTFSLPDGKDSSYYVNLKGLPSYPGVYGLVVEALAQLVSRKSPKANAICAVPLTGLLLASPVAVALKKPLVYTRLERQENERLVEGEVRPGWKVAIIGDLATSGKTILSAADAIEDEGGEVTSAIVLIDRLEGAREKLSKRGIALHAVTDMVELADTLHSMELISSDNLKSITKSVGSR
jgi:orotate phosphoribosyltransferase